MVRGMRFSEQLRQAIRRSGITSYRLAQESGVDESSLSKFMRGGAMTTRSLDAIAEVLRFRLEMQGPRVSVLQKKRRG